MRKPLVVLAVLMVLSAGQGLAGQQPIVARNAAIVGCFAAQDWVIAELKDIGLVVGANAEVVLHFGSIPDASPSNNDDFQVMFYSADRTKAWLGLGLYDPTGRITMIHNGYRLVRDGSRWSVSEGNGGMLTYAAVAVHATRLDSSVKTRMTLVAKASAPCNKVSG